MAQLRTPYESIVDVQNIATGKFAHPETVVRLGLTEQLPPVASDAKKILVIGIDYQNDFVLPDKSQVADGEPYGSLSVPGSKGDLERFTRFIYDNISKITRIFLSNDTHFVYQIFSEAMWKDENGNYVSPGTIITPDDISNGKYRFIGGNQAIAKQCAETLIQSGEPGIYIWPPHCYVNTFGWCVETQLMQMVHFHCSARKAIGKDRPVPTFKGTDVYSEMYGFLEPKFNPKGEALVNKAVLDVLARMDKNSGEPRFEYDEIYVGGEAGSHCLPESVEQILKRFANYPEFTQRITILEDCTSPVPGFENRMTDAFERFKRTYGVQIKKSTDITL